MTEIWGIALGAAIGASAACAYKWRVGMLVKREQKRAAQAIENERREQSRLRDELRYAQEKLGEERQSATLQREQEVAWETGYTDGLRDGANRTEAQQFLAVFENGGAATMMMRRQRRGWRAS